MISDFNADLLGRYLSNVLDPAPEIEAMPFGQVYQSLATATSDPRTATVLWARPEGVSALFARALEFEEINVDSVLTEVDEFVGAVSNYARQGGAVLVTSWTMPPGNRGYGMLDFRPGTGLAHLVTRMNLRLVDGLADIANAFVLDAERWLRAVGPRASSPKMWYAGKVPYGNPVFEQAAFDVAAALDALAGTSKRLIVLDLDNTVWGGIIGETGWQGLALGGHDHVGEAYVGFQQGLLALRRRGIQLAVVSKNDEAVALEAFDNHPEMVVRRNHLAGWRINWEDKAENVASLVAELNLGLASVVFIDDSPIERARVKETFPEVLVPDWPQDPAMYRSALEALRCFDTSTVSAEDRQRGEMYSAERERRDSFERVGSLAEWLKTLGIRIEADGLSDANAKRAAQLFNKTNQMNLSTRRLDEAELRAWAEHPSRRLWTVTVSDRFGASGLTGIVSVELEDGAARIVDFLLSCRVMGRQVEETMLFLAESFAWAEGARAVVAEFRPTPRNRPCLDFLERSGLERVEENVFARRLHEPPSPPECVTLVGMPLASA